MVDWLTMVDFTFHNIQNRAEVSILISYHILQYSKLYGFEYCGTGYSTSTRYWYVLRTTD